MKSYDDLQRFKEKTQTNHIEFKDMSEQAINSDSTNWAIIKQLLNEGAGSVLDNRQRIDLAAPQPIDSAAFSPPPAEMPAVALHLPVHSYVAAAPMANDKIGASLLDSISASLQAGPPEVATAQPVAAATPVADAAPLRAMPLARQTAVAGSSLLEQLSASTPVKPVVQSAPAPVAQAPQPVAAAAAPQPVMAAAAPVNASFKQLFSPAAAPAPQALSKDVLLQPLLEKIASCR